jgi:transcription elongation GreA/GreB family factor
MAPQVEVCYLVTMPEFVFTPFGRRLLEEAIREVQAKLKQASLEKGEEASGQDSWHDEGYKLANVNEMMWSQRYQKLKTILDQGKLITPAEQTEKVLPGNGVRVRYEDDVIEHFILEGYLIKPVANRASYLSPLGIALMNATKGRRVTFSGGGRTIALTIEEIFAPSALDRFPEFQG